VLADTGQRFDDETVADAMFSRGYAGRADDSATNWNEVGLVLGGDRRLILRFDGSLDREFRTRIARRRPDGLQTLCETPLKVYAKDSRLASPSQWMAPNRSGGVFQGISRSLSRRT